MKDKLKLGTYILYEFLKKLTDNMLAFGHMFIYFGAFVIIIYYSSNICRILVIGCLLLSTMIETIVKVNKYKNTYNKESK